MKTAMVSLSLSREGGGLFGSMLGSARHLLERGEQIEMLAVEDPATREDLGRWEPVPARALPSLGPRSIGFAPRLEQVLAAGDFDLLHTHGLWTYPSAAVLRWHRRTGRPYAVSPHGMLDPWAARNSRWKKRLAAAVFENEHLRRAGCLRALCEAESESIREFGLTNPVCVIPNGVDLPLLDGARAQPRKARILLFLGRIHPKKGLPALLRAWAAIRPTEWALAIAGWEQGGHEKELKGQASTLGLSWRAVDLDHLVHLEPSAIGFLGPRHGIEKENCLRICDACVLPSLSEGLPMAVLEAWAFAKPVAMTSHCNLPEGFSRGAALVLESEKIEEGLRALFQNDLEELTDMGAQGRRLVEEKFTWPRVAESLHALHLWLAKGGPKPACVSELP